MTLRPPLRSSLMPACRFFLATANRPGAIAIVQVLGASNDLLSALTGVHKWPLHQVRLVNLAGIDEGLAVRLNATVAQIMPHGGPRVVQRLTAKLIELGAQLMTDESSLDLQETYPEAADFFEAAAMAGLARAQSPLAIDLLLDQPRRWRELARLDRPLSAEDHARSHRLNRLINPPIVVVAGRPNVGKSTLSNALLGRSMSIALDMPGTTRDYTAGRVDLAGLVVDWHDTPGIRDSDDPIERKAIELARGLLERADLIISMSDPQSAGPDLPREPDLRVMNKIDLLRESNDIRRVGVLAISAVTGEGIAAFVENVRDKLVSPADLKNPGVWMFDPRLGR